MPVLSSPVLSRIRLKDLRPKTRALLGKIGARLPRIETQFPAITRRWRQAFAILLILSSAAGVITAVLTLTDVDVSVRAWDPLEVITKSRLRLQAISGSLDSSRDRLARDREVRLAMASRNKFRLFPVLADRDQAASRIVADSLLFSNTGSDAMADHGEAAYDPDGHILAWYSSHPGVFGFDTLLSGAALLPTGERDTYLESDPLHAYLNSVRKVTDRGAIVGYILVKRQLETSDPSTAEQSTTFIDDIRDAAHRDVVLEFGPHARAEHSDTEWTRTALYASPDLPDSYVGTLSVSDDPASDPASITRMLRTFWSLGWSAILIAILVWVTFGLLRGIHARTRSSARFMISVLLLLLLALGRVLLVQFGGLEALAGQRVQDSTDFGALWGWGIVSNPFELFVTTVFAIVVSALLWLVWAPRERLLAVQEESLRRPRQRVLLRTIYVIGALFLAAALTDALSYAVHSTVINSSYQYLSIKQVWPSRPLLMMLLSFLGIGVSYLFLVVLLLAFAARALSLMVPERVRPRPRAAIGSAMLCLLFASAVALVDTWGLEEVGTNYRWALAAVTLLITVAIVLVDAFVERSDPSTSSFLYRLPRSSRSLLFVLAISAALLSPLIADWQLRGDQEIAEHMVEENAGADAPELTTSIGSALATAQSILDENTDKHSPGATEETRQAAFLTWLRSLRAHANWNAIVDVYERDGTLLSHFATAGAMAELPRLHAVRDSMIRLASRSGQVNTSVVQCFTGSCTPAVVGALRYMSADSFAAILTISAWSDLPTLAVERPNFDLLRSANTNPATERGFVVGQYRSNMRRVTNQPSLDVPPAVPYDVEQQLQRRHSIWRSSSIGSTEYQTLYYRSQSDQASGAAGSIVTVSIPMPTIGRKMEFGLRLNAIGLLYGTVIALLLLGIRQVTQKRVYFTLRFRDRIFLVVLLIALVPLVVVTNVTRSLLTQRAQMEEQDRLARDASVIKDRIARQMESGVVNIFGLDLQSDVDELAQIIGRDFSIFDPDGFLRASTKPELYESSLLSSTMSSRAMREVVLGRRTFYSEPLLLNHQRYQVGYQPVMSSQGNKLLAVVSLSTADEQAQIEAEVARTTSFIYGTFAALGLVLLAIGAVFAARVASPIMALIRATQRVAQGKLKTHITVDRDDEIGELMQAFNVMTEDLEKSREIVAQNERELAWKEMARQVAHEIKNPLTPMKLSVQHLDHAHEAKDPNFNSIFRRVIRTLSEQIDVLTRIATEFSRFGEMPRRKWGPVSLRKVAESAVALFDAERSRIRFIVDVPSELSDVHADEQEFRRALVNLIRNAVQAIEGWGVIVIRATQEGGMIHMKVSDTGGGMDEATLARVFDPNFSTKTSGMGLGLAIVKKTITDMAGTIRVESRLGHGTTFFIDLPARGYVEEADD